MLSVLQAKPMDCEELQAALGQMLVKELREIWLTLVVPGTPLKLHQITLFGK